MGSFEGNEQVWHLEGGGRVVCSVFLLVEKEGDLCEEKGDDEEDVVQGF